LSSFNPRLTPVASANTKSTGISSGNVLSPELVEAIVAQGSNALENPGVVTLPDGSSVTIMNYGYDGDGPFLPTPGDLPSATHKVEASKTEPDKNTYLRLWGQKGADPHYNYGTHFLFQGHETGMSGYITRVNLDADGAHRITLLATTDVNGKNLPVFDGSTWDPFAQRLLFTAELGNNGGVWQATLDVRSKVEDMAGSMGRGGYEGIQNDSNGNVWIVEDVGGKAGTAAPHAKQPNSFVYRFIPKSLNSLAKGKLQALQVISARTGQPIAFHAGQMDADILSDDVKDIHTYGVELKTHWVTLHDTELDGNAAFDANALAKAALATPFKRPENGLFRPGSRFTEFYFDETGDTNSLTEAGSAYGGFGGILKLTQNDPSADNGTLTAFFVGDVAHTGLDNVGFWDRDHVVFVEDAGDGLHTQRNALDSAYMFDLRLNYGDAANVPVRILAEGRDPSATIDSGFSGMAGFQNEGDNEITGFHVSNGDPSILGILGAQLPKPFSFGWRVFYTQQHGDNMTWEILGRPSCDK
jgi:hypothetical protein